MISLIIDTSSDHCILALTESSKILASAIFAHQNQLSQQLVPTIKKLLTDTGMHLSAIQQISAGMGPGSYTGTRVGVTVAKSLAFGREIPLRGFCSLLAFLPTQTGRFAALMPAKSGEIFVLKGTQIQDTLIQETAELMSPTQTLQSLADVDYIATRELPIPFPRQIYSFSPNLHPLLLALQQSPVFPFEKEGHLIYLHHPA